MFVSRPQESITREFTNVRRQRQDVGYQYNDINPIAQKKLIIYSFQVGVLNVVQALWTTGGRPRN